MFNFVKLLILSISLIYVEASNEDELIELNRVIVNDENINNLNRINVALTFSKGNLL
jgi:hypothetical protein